MPAVTGETPFSRIVRMTGAFAASDVARSGLNFALSIAVARGLGRDAFGEWAFCMAFASTLTVVFDLGLNTLLTRDAARDAAAAGQLLTDALTARVGLFLPAAFIVYRAAPRIGIGSQPTETMHVIVWLAGFGIAYGCFAAVFRAWPQWLVPILAIETAGAGVQCVATVAAVRRGGGVVDVLVVATAVQVAQLVAAYVMWGRIAPSNRLSPPRWRSARARLGRAFPFALTGLVANAQARIAPLLLGYLAAEADLAAFSAASRLGSLVRLLPYAAFGAAFAVFSHEVDHGDPVDVRARFDRMMSRFTLAASVGVLVAAPLLVRVSYGVRFASASTPLMWMAIGLWPSLANSARRVFLLASGRERIALHWSATALVIQTVGCAVLIPILGATGAAIALAAGEAAIWAPLRAAELHTIVPFTTRCSMPSSRA